MQNFWFYFVILGNLLVTLGTLLKITLAFKVGGTRRNFSKYYCTLPTDVTIQIHSQKLHLHFNFCFPLPFLPCSLQFVFSIGLEDMTTLILGLGVFCQWCGLLRFLSYFDTYNVSGWCGVGGGRGGEGDEWIGGERCGSEGGEG